jgi:sugar/nucleoside kinase (ribokinase family)
MRKVYTIGETVLDIILKDNQPFATKAGGACLNSAVTLGRLGLPSYFIGEYGLSNLLEFPRHRIISIPLCPPFNPPTSIL